MTLQTFILLLPSFALAFTLILWMMYLATMNLQLVKHQGRLPKAVEPYTKLVIVVSLALDFLYNQFVATVIFMDLPRELLLTDRLERYKYGHITQRLEKVNGEYKVVQSFIPADTTNWRYREACYWGDVFLDPYDPDGSHLHSDEPKARESGLSV